jgi:predicted dehydrogenase
MMGKKIRAGLTGAGFMGQTFAHALREIPGVELVAVAEGSRAPALARDFGIELEPNAQALAQRPDLDAILITTPQQVHCREALWAFEHGKHVFCEKPQATSVEDCDRMNEAAQKQGRLLGLGYHQRQREGNQTTYQLLRQNAIGRVLSIQAWLMFDRLHMVDSSGIGSTWSWWDEPESIGHILAGGVHAIDLLRWFLEAEVATVYARCDTFRKNTPTENHTMATLTMTNGTVISLWATSVCPSPVFPGNDFHFWLMGESGIIDHNPYDRVQLGNAAGWQTVFQQPPIGHDSAAQVYRRPRLQAYIDELANFFEAIQGRAELFTTGSDGRAGVEAALAMLASSQGGQVIDLR